MNPLIEDLQEAHAMGRAVRDHGPYNVRIGMEGLQFQKVTVDQPVVTGNSLLAAVSALPVEEHLIFKITPAGLTEELRPDAEVDLRSSGIERFVVFRSDRAYRFMMNERAFDWGAALISGTTLIALAGVNVTDHQVWQQVHGELDRAIEEDQHADLAAKGVEHFVTRTLAFTIVVNANPKEVFQRKLGYWEVVKLGFADAQQSDRIIYTVNYARGPHANPEGALVDGQFVKIKNKMVFYVTPTDRS